MLNNDMKHRIRKMENGIRRKLRRKGIKLIPPNQTPNQTGNIPSEYNSSGEYGILRRKIAAKTDIDYKDLPF